ncbi:MAG: acetylglutamate kinase [Clostridia bacterium]|nr:acetylglutamate kinase [Clostridia bacterium]
MMTALTPEDRAAMFVEVLPYIKELCGKTVVVKYGGNAMANEELKRAVAFDLVFLKSIGANPVVVHGGGPDINQMMARIGKKPAFVSGLRITDPETMEIVQMVLCGKLNKEIVSLIGDEGGRAIGISGHDARLIRARKRPPERVVDRETGEEQLVDLGQVGDVEEIDPSILRDLARDGYIPAVSTVGMGDDGRAYNINADYVAAEIACSLGADVLVMLTDVEGIFGNYKDKSTLIPQLSIDDARAMVSDGRVEGGMIPKVQSCIGALEGGVGRAHIIDGRRPHSIILELCTHAGIGTELVP